MPRLARTLGLFAVPAAAVAGFLFFPTAQAQPPVELAVAKAEADRVAVIAKVRPAVVAVLNHDGSNGGSGVLISPDGYALTNFHVTDGTGTFPKCGLADGVLYDGVLVGHDRVGDVALIKLLPKKEGAPFPFVPLGDSDKVRVGDWSLAMGNPFLLASDFTPTVTYGLVSGVNRYQPPEGKGFLEYTDCIQVDTSINPGNSGGPLFNVKGELIGINGRGSFEKRGRVNSGVGYAISINQIKNFLGHLHAGLDADHATLGAAVGTADENADLTKIVVRQILEESDAFRRGVQNNDQIVSFAGRPLTSTNQYKNILGIFPKGWRVPVVIRRENDRREVLVRLMGAMAVEKDTGMPPAPGGPPMPPRPGLPVPKKDVGPKEKAPGEVFFKEKPGYANWYFNEQMQRKLLDAARRHGDFATAAGTWTAEGTYDLGVRKGNMRFEVNPGKEGDPLVTLLLNIEEKLSPLKGGQSEEELKKPVGSGGLMLALYHYHRFLTLGPKGFEGDFSHGGYEPFYPAFPGKPVEAEVIHTRHGSGAAKWYFSRQDQTLLGFELSLTKDEDPCEVYLSDYKPVEGRMLPHRIEVRRGDTRYAVLTVAKFTTNK